VQIRVRFFKEKPEGSIASDWGTSDNNRKARYYRLTKAGRKQLAAARVSTVEGFFGSRLAGTPLCFFAISMSVFRSIMRTISRRD